MNATDELNILTLSCCGWNSLGELLRTARDCLGFRHSLKLGILLLTIRHIRADINLGSVSSEDHPQRVLP